MFLKLFGSIRNNGVPVTLKEYLDLLEGLSKGLCSSNKIEDFYNFSWLKMKKTTISLTRRLIVFMKKIKT